jgi:hypothetical protein
VQYQRLRKYSQIIVRTASPFFDRTRLGFVQPTTCRGCKKWEANRQENLQMNFVVKTKLVNDSMYLSIKSDAYPAYLDYVSYLLSNKDG